MSALATAEPWDLVAAAYTVEAVPYFEAPRETKEAKQEKQAKEDE